MRVYLTGASGTGKTTLAARVAEVLGLPLIPSAARRAMTETATKSGELFTNPIAVDRFQDAVWRNQLAFEGALADNGFVSDRCLDHVVYHSLMGTPRAVHARFVGAELSDHVKSLKKPDALVFLIRPHRHICEKARDGLRDPWLTDEMTKRFDGGLSVLMAVTGVPFYDVTDPDLESRVDQVLRTVRLKFPEPATRA